MRKHRKRLHASVRVTPTIMQPCRQQLKPYSDSCYWILLTSGQALWHASSCSVISRSVSAMLPPGTNMPLRQHQPQTHPAKHIKCLRRPELACRHMPEALDVPCRAALVVYVIPSNSGHLAALQALCTCAPLLAACSPPGHDSDSPAMNFPHARYKLACCIANCRWLTLLQPEQASINTSPFKELLSGATLACVSFMLLRPLQCCGRSCHRPLNVHASIRTHLFPCYSAGQQQQTPALHMSESPGRSYHSEQSKLQSQALDITLQVCNLVCCHVFRCATGMWKLCWQLRPFSIVRAWLITQQRQAICMRLRGMGAQQVHPFPHMAAYQDACSRYLARKLFWIYLMTGSNPWHFAHTSVLMPDHPGGAVRALQSIWAVYRKGCCQLFWTLAPHKPPGEHVSMVCWYHWLFVF